ncbi:MAG: potassium channel protein [candidate division Zixibacteria bacterium]|nr:potassium channel protein [candidate division Zixibacteria bacterium]
MFRGEFVGVRRLLPLILSVLLFGMVGFRIIEGWTLLDSLYMTIITLSTVGYGEVHNLSVPGRVFATILIIFGVGTVAYTFGVIGQFIVEGKVREIFGKRKMEKQLQSMDNHYIICGYGRVGSQVCEEFAVRRVAFVVVEYDEKNIGELLKTDYVYIQGNATDDEILKSAGIEKAKGLVSTLASEADNVYLALSARHLNPNLTITCRADSAAAEKKIYRAGANRVISPYIIGGLRMALATLRPNVVDFLQVAASGPAGNFRIEELSIKADSPITDKKILELDFRAKKGITILGIRKPDKTMIRNPSAETIIEAGDIIILLGEAAQLEALESEI